MEEIPGWMRVSSHRDLEEEGKSKHQIMIFALLCLFAVSLFICIVVAFEYPIYLTGPVLSASGIAFIMVLTGLRRSGKMVTLIYLPAAVTSNCLMTYVAYHFDLNDGLSSAIFALAGVIIFTGLIGLVILSRTKQRLPRLTKSVIMGTMVVMLFASMRFGAISSDGIFAYVHFWMLAAIAPMMFLFVMTFLTVIAFHRDEVTLPSDGWV